MATKTEWPTDLSEPIYFANKQWAVTSYGLECVTDQYFIDAERLGDRKPGPARLSDWIPHVCAKRWVSIPAFCEAFRKALVIHKGRYEGGFSEDQLAFSEIMATRSRKKAILHSRAFRKWHKKVFPGDQNKKWITWNVGNPRIIAFGDQWDEWEKRRGDPDPAK